MAEIATTIDYYIDIPNKQIQNVDNISPVEITDILSLVDNPEDLTRSRVKNVTKNRENPIYETVTLKRELTEITERFKADVKNFTPSTKEAQTLENVKLLANGHLLIDDNNIINPNTLQGAIFVEILNAQARGEDLSQVYQIIHESIDQFSLKSSEKTLQGHSMSALTVWPKGKLFYKWSDTIEKNTKTELTTAMKEWSEKTKNAITFHEITADNITTSLGLQPYFLFENADLTKSNRAGEANVGYRSGSQIGVLRIQSKLDFFNLHQITRHELGHMIGLKHEHQRWDRDQFITVTQKGVGYDILPKTKTTTTVYNRTRQKFIPIFWWGWGYYIDEPYKQSVTTTVTNTATSKEFDCKSIMMYAPFTTKQACSGFNKNETIDVFDILNITDQDVDYVQGLYLHETYPGLRIDRLY
jgi:hypothetical protein